MREKLFANAARLVPVNEKGKHMMKKILLLTAALAICSVSAVSAATIQVRVMDFRFQRATINARVGDVVVWRWVNGMHTTTSTNIPAGARTWNRPIDVGNQQFRYRLQVPGTYQYQCNFHVAQGMLGTINVTGAPEGAVGGAID